MLPLAAILREATDNFSHISQLIGLTNNQVIYKLIYSAVSLNSNTFILGKCANEVTIQLPR